MQLLSGTANSPVNLSPQITALAAGGGPSFSFLDWLRGAVDSNQLPGEGETGGLLAAMGLTAAHVGTISDGPMGGGESAKIAGLVQTNAGGAQCLGRKQENASADGAAAETTSESLEPAIKLIPACTAIGVGGPATATNVAPGREPLQSPVEGSPAGRKVVEETEIPQKQADAFGHGAPTLFSAGPKVRAHHRPDAPTAEDPKPRCRSSFEDLPMAVAAPALPSPIEPPPVASTPAASAEVAVAPHVVLPAFEKNTAAVTNAGNGVVEEQLVQWATADASTDGPERRVEFRATMDSTGSSGFVKAPGPLPMTAARVEAPAEPPVGESIQTDLAIEPTPVKSAAPTVHRGDKVRVAPADESRLRAELSSRAGRDGIAGAPETQEQTRPVVSTDHPDLRTDRATRGQEFEMARQSEAQSAATGHASEGQVPKLNSGQIAARPIDAPDAGIPVGGASVAGQPDLKPFQQPAEAAASPFLTTRNGGYGARVRREEAPWVDRRSAREAADGNVREGFWANAEPLSQTQAGRIRTNTIQANPFAHLDRAIGAPAQLLHASSRELDVGLRDPAMGWVEIKAHLASGQVSASLAAESHAAHSSLVAELPAMAQYLADRDIGVSRLAVESQAAQSNSHGGGHPGHPGAGDTGEGRKDSERRIDEPRVRPPVETEFEPVRSAKGTIDIRA